MFTITKTPFGPYTKVTLHNTTMNESLSFVPEHGCILLDVILSKNNKLYTITKAHQTPEAIKENSFKKGSFLAPFPGRLNKGFYSFNGQNYALPIALKHGHAIHGFLLDKPFQIIKEDVHADKAVVTMTYISPAREGYPFPFTAEVAYRLDTTGMTCIVTITNTGKTTMPLGIGWHPYFTLPIPLAELELQLPMVEMLLTDQTNIPNGMTAPSKTFKKLRKLRDLEIDACFHITTTERATTLLHDPKENVSIAVWQEAKDYPYLIVFIPPARDCIALEPLSCAPDAFNNGKGLILLEAGKNRTFHYGIQLI
jgi:aldose 1-epimerase